MYSLYYVADAFYRLGVPVLILALAATVLAFIFIVPEKKYDKLNNFGKFVHRILNFEFLIIEKVLQALYIFSTALVIIIGFFMLFLTTGYGYGGGYGLLLMILGPVIIRLSYELVIMVILLVKNVININGKLKNQNQDSEMADYFATPTAEELKATFSSNRTAPVAREYKAPAAPSQPAPAAEEYKAPVVPEQPAPTAEDVETPVAPEQPAPTAENVETPVAPEQPAPIADRFCYKCGSMLNEDGICPTCSAPKADRFCYKCGSMLNEDGICPTCSAPKTDRYCYKCGSMLNENGICPNCGK